MSDTKACNLTENELKQLITWHGYSLSDNGSIDSDVVMNDRIERINYLNRRLKTFKEPEITVGAKQGNSAEAVTSGVWPTNG